ncbi:MAG: aminotransferase class I/II-fold pyridoxal phosphate-dependent enzyme [Geminicoccaceae bacterium]
MRDRLATLGLYAFQRLNRLLAEVPPPEGVAPLDLSIGEPKHAPPAWLGEVIAAQGDSWNRYPPVRGTPPFREACARWLQRRYGVMLDADRQILPVAGTKESLFMLATLAMDRFAGSGPPAILMPNPVYPVYYGAAVMAGAEPVLLDTPAAHGFLPDLAAIEPALLERTAALYLCSPSNPQGMAADAAYWAKAVALAQRHGFLLIADECYAELYYGAPPAGVLPQALASEGQLAHVVACHSLSKRSNAAGLRAGFVAASPELIDAFAKLRSYSAAVQPMPVLAAATALLDDEAHVVENRARYAQKMADAADLIGDRFGFYQPDGGFFLWLEVADGEQAALDLWQRAAVKTLPGSYTAHAHPDGRNPAQHNLRVALVHARAANRDALLRMVEVLEAHR